MPFRSLLARRVDELVASGLALIYPAFVWSVVLRAIMDISARAISLEADFRTPCGLHVTGQGLRESSKMLDE
jgi:hypothetical protein